MAHDGARAAKRAMEAGGAAAGPPSFEALLRQLVDRETYPLLYKIAWSNDIGDDPTGFDDQEKFLFGVDRILDGADALMKANRVRRRAPAKSARRSR